MGRNDFQRLEELFHRASSLAPDERGPFLDAECPPALRTQLDELLSDRGADDFFEELKEELGIGEQGDRATLRGRVIGRWRLEELLGRGGMGAVYLGARDDGVYDQRVAIKLLPIGIDSDLLRRRFRAERRILAGLEHPNIARLIDGGISEDGTPYFVMEYVEGTTLDDYCEAKNLSVQDRLRLFLTVCDAVQFAHQNLVVHRDLKPANILVADGGEPKLLDFGIARVLDSDLGASPSTVTRDARSYTPGYASPEQIAGGDITTASDTYSLGVVLYLIITGQLPRYPAEAAKYLTGVSRRGGRAVSGDRLDGDLVSVLRKSLELEPAHRYGTAAAFAADLRRYLDGETVLAHPPSLPYRTRKYLGRNRTQVTFAVLVTAGLMSTAFGFVRATRAQQLAEAEATTALRVSEFMVDLFTLADPGAARGNRVTAREILDSRAADVEAELSDQPRIQGRLLESMGRAYMGLGLFEESEAMFERSLAVREAAFGPADGEVGSSLRWLAWIKRARGRTEEGLSDAERSLAILTEAPEAFAEHLPWSLMTLGVLERDAGRLDDAAEHLDRAVRAQQTVDSVSVAFASMLLERGWLHYVRGNPGSAREDYGRALDLIDRTVGRVSREGAAALQGLAFIEAGLGNDEEAADAMLAGVSIREELLGPDHPQVAEAYNNLGAFEYQRQNNEAATRHFRRALDVGRRALPDDHPELATYQSNLALALRTSVRLGEARPMFEGALDILRDRGSNPLRLANTLSNYGSLLWGLGELERARRALEEATSLFAASGGDAAPQLIEPLAFLAYVNLERGDVSSGLQSAARAVEIVEAIGAEPRRAEYARHTLAHAHFAAGNDDEAERLGRMLAEAGSLETSGEGHVILAAVLRRRGEAEAARAQLEAGFEKILAAGEREPPSYRTYLEARRLAAFGSMDRALETFEEAVSDGLRTTEIVRHREFDAIRDDPRFQRLVRIVSDRVAAS